MRGAKAIGAPARARREGIQQFTELIDLALNGFEPVMTIDNFGRPTAIWHKEGESPFVSF